MKEKRRKYDEEFKKNAAKLTYGSRKGVSEIAQGDSIYFFSYL